MTYIFTNTQEIKNDIGDPISTYIVDRHGFRTEGGGSIEYLINIANGMHDDLSFFHQNGYIQNNFSNGDTVWDGGVPYPWNALVTTQTLYVKSSTNNATDRGCPIIISGLDSNFIEQTEELFLDATNSTTAIPTTKQFLRINSIAVNDGIVNEGDITAHTVNGSGTTVGIIPAGFGRSHTATYTVPAGYTAFLMKSSFSSTTAITIGYFIRQFGKGFKVQHIGVADNGQYIYDFPIPLPFPEKSDMDVRGLVASGRCSVSWDMLLIKN